MLALYHIIIIIPSFKSLNESSLHEHATREVVEVARPRSRRGNNRTLWRIDVLGVQ